MSSTNEEKMVLQKFADILIDGLPDSYGKANDPDKVTTFFNQNRYDGLQPGRRLCMVDIGNTNSYEQLPDELNYEGGGLTMKTITIRIYVFSNVLNQEHVNIGTEREPGVLDLEQDVWNVINVYPLLNLNQLVMRWKVISCDRDAWKNNEIIVGTTITLEVEVGDRDRINP